MKEAASLPFGGELAVWGIILIELASPYFLLIAPPAWKRNYLIFFTVGVLALSLYYLVTYRNILDYRFTCIYTNEPLAVVLHIVYALIFVWIAFIKG